MGQGGISFWLRGKRGGGKGIGVALLSQPESEEGG